MRSSSFRGQGTHQTKGIHDNIQNMQAFFQPQHPDVISLADIVGCRPTDGKAMLEYIVVHHELRGASKPSETAVRLAISQAREQVRPKGTTTQTITQIHSLAKLFLSIARRHKDLKGLLEKEAALDKSTPAPTEALVIQTFCELLPSAARDYMEDELLRNEELKPAQIKLARMEQFFQENQVGLGIILLTDRGYAKRAQQAQVQQSKPQQQQQPQQQQLRQQQQQQQGGQQKTSGPAKSPMPKKEVQGAAREDQGSRAEKEKAATPVSGDTAAKQCYYCEQVGHFKVNCPDKAAGKESKARMRREQAKAAGQD